MIGCIPETVPVKPSNPDGRVGSNKSAEEAKDVIKTAKKNSHRSNRAKKNNKME